jgi:hypothetical protein
MPILRIKRRAGQYEESRRLLNLGPLFVSCGPLSFRESYMPETHFPGISALGNWVNKAN